MTEQTSKPAGGGIDLVRAFRWLSLILAALVVIQAALAGRYFFFGKVAFLDAHRTVGIVCFIVAIGLCWVAMTGRRAGVLDQIDFALTGVLFLLIFAQLGLGFSGKDSQTAASLHWPNGVLITAVTAVLLGRTIPHRKS